MQTPATLLSPRTPEPEVKLAILKTVKLLQAQGIPPPTAQSIATRQAENATGRVMETTAPQQETAMGQGMYQQERDALDEPAGPPADR